MTAPHVRHVNRQSTADRLSVVLSRRARTGETVVWDASRPVPTGVTR